MHDRKEIFYYLVTYIHSKALGPADSLDLLYNLMNYVLINGNYSEKECIEIFDNFKNKHLQLRKENNDK